MLTARFFVLAHNDCWTKTTFILSWTVSANHLCMGDLLILSSRPSKHQKWCPSLYMLRQGKKILVVLINFFFQKGACGRLIFFFNLNRNPWHFNCTKSRSDILARSKCRSDNLYQPKYRDDNLSWPKCHCDILTPPKYRCDILYHYDDILSGPNVAATFCTVLVLQQPQEHHSTRWATAAAIL